MGMEALSVEHIEGVYVQGGVVCPGVVKGVVVPLSTGPLVKGVVDPLRVCEAL